MTLMTVVSDTNGRLRFVPSETTRKKRWWRRMKVLCKRVSQRSSSEPASDEPRTNEAEQAVGNLLWSAFYKSGKYLDI